MSEKTPAQIIKELIPGEFKGMGKVAPSGSIKARKIKNGAVKFYWRFTFDGKTDREPIGLYDRSAPPKSINPTGLGYSFAAAEKAAQDMAARHEANKDAGGWPALVAAEIRAKRAAEATQQDAAKNTLRKLLEAYCDHLQKLGRDAHRNARSIFTRHVFEQWPVESNMPANQIEPKQVANMMRKVREAGKERTSKKLRSYMRAAYATAIAADTDADVPVKFQLFKITVNPVAQTAVGVVRTKADKNPLTGDQLRTYWQSIKNKPGMQGAVLRLHLLTGGQRIEQLVRLRARDVKGDALTLFDGKGRPGTLPRVHPVPLTPLAVAALKEFKTSGEYVISTDGKTHIAGTTLSGWAAAAAEGIPDFKAKRIRSGVETLLASLGVSKDVRGRLQSHGIGGVQDTHYDAYEYMPEKRDALTKLYNFLQRKAGAKVVQLRA
ncbi:MAG: integrase [Burkholderiaceae bacterium]|nr:integrase [Burkholderiaceae bacterium]